jgi:hypothetical protein
MSKLLDFFPPLIFLYVTVPTSVYIIRPQRFSNTFGRLEILLTAITTVFCKTD